MLCYIVISYTCYISRDPNIDENGSESASVWPVYTVESRDYKDFNADWLFEPESHKTGSLRAHSCAMWNWYLPRVEGWS